MSKTPLFAFLSQKMIFLQKFSEKIVKNFAIFEFLTNFLENFFVKKYYNYKKLR